ncbi:MAG: 4Fe-4S binding protein [Chromatiaceae bacterium]|nr:4Fe-4S binding protein [Gammaproteobacteria bacterium]MCP5427573.1 4Fe-4S binding protein [Chromatiaceae bacterium]MCB1860994.1 4Fe-4S binding protein [Gammaproteobacteria bacterium]MCB1871829.1 4Fe-4S binding protein [Gammaproteobacteria bacterium]MCB1878640.1 4Fe-4S binding protein [Gammaproteobacteria bacterium]
MSDIQTKTRAKTPGRKSLSGKRKEQARREFLRTSVMAAGVVGFSLLGFLPVVQGTSLRLRPPGAIKTTDDEKEFLASCIKCGQCVQVCPVQAINLSDMDEGFGIGTPFIDARAQACDFSCDGLQCVLACPTGSLNHDLNFPADTRMGFAKLSRPAACLAIQGKGFKGQARGPDYKGVLRYDEVDRWNPIPVANHPYDLELCDLCVRQCPIEIRIAQCAEKKETASGAKLARVAEQVGNECPPVHAIALEEVAMPNGEMRTSPVIKQGCVGCGVCEMICPPEPPAIVIDIHKITDLG